MIGYNTIRYTATAALVGLTLACATPKRSPLEEALSFRNPDTTYQRESNVDNSQNLDQREEVVAIPEAGNAITQFKEKYSCIGVGEMPAGIKNPSLAKKAAMNKAREDYRRQCVSSSQVGGEINGVETLWNEEQKVAIAYYPWETPK